MRPLQTSALAIILTAAGALGAVAQTQGGGMTTPPARQPGAPTMMQGSGGMKPGGMQHGQMQGGGGMQPGRSPWQFKDASRLRSSPHGTPSPSALLIAFQRLGNPADEILVRSRSAVQQTPGAA